MLNIHGDGPAMDELLSQIRTAKSTARNKKGDESVLEITSSQADRENVISYDADMDLIAKYRTDESIKAIEIKRGTEYKINRPFYGFIKRVERDGDVFIWEVCDETGSIKGSSTVSERVGSIVCLKGCSVWRITENHLNIVEGNITRLV